MNKNKVIARTVSELTTEEEVLRQLAEELCEAAQAALKVIRVTDHTTPVDRDVAILNLADELGDVHNCLQVIDEKIPEIKVKSLEMCRLKMKRWLERLLER